MAKKTLLELCQDIANDLEVDEFESINDTMEAIQIAQIVRTAYDEIISNRNWSHLKTTFQLLRDDSVAGDLPTHLKVPELVKELITLNVNKRKSTDNSDKFVEIYYVQPEDFLRRTNKRRSEDDNISIITDEGGVNLYIRNDEQPQYYTSFNDETIVLDAWDASIDEAFPASKTQCLGYVGPVWEHSDDFIPDLPSEAFSSLLSEAKSTAFLVLKQTPNPKEEQRADRQKRWLSRKDWKVSGGVRRPDYGRRGRGFVQTSPLLDKNGPIGKSTNS